MRVFIAGATGVLGRRLVTLLGQRGHEVVGLARSDKNAELIARLGGEPRRADIFNAKDLATAAAGCEAILHTATAIPTSAKPRPAEWETNDRLRREGTQALAACAAAVGAKVFVLESIVWLARPHDGGPFDESSPPRPDKVTASMADAEQITQLVAGARGFTSVILRCGMFYCDDAAHIKDLAAGLKKRQIPIIGDGTAAWRLLHVDDAASAFAQAIESRPSGIWHVVDDEAVSASEYLDYFAERLGAKPPRHIPVWLARLFMGYLLNFYVRSTRTSNKPFCEATGWAPQYPSYREGIDQIMAAWEDDGGRMTNDGAISSAGSRR